jgi:hypothetical protein
MEGGTSRGMLVLLVDKLLVRELVVLVVEEYAPWRTPEVAFAEVAAADDDELEDEEDEAPLSLDAEAAAAAVPFERALCIEIMENIREVDIICFCRRKKEVHQ